MQLLKLTCQYCGAGLQVEEGLDLFYCTYCGKKTIIDNDERLKAKVKIEQMHHEERMQVAELRSKERMQAKKLETEERIRTSDPSAEAKMISVALTFLFALFVLTFGVIIFMNISDSRKARQGLVVPNVSISSKTYADFEMQLSEKGFKNIETIELEEKPLFKKSYYVESVTVNGEAYASGTYYSLDDRIVVYYYP